MEPGAFAAPIDFLPEKRLELAATLRQGRKAVGIGPLAFDVRPAVAHIGECFMQLAANRGFSCAAGDALRFGVLDIAGEHEFARCLAVGAVLAPRQPARAQEIEYPCVDAAQARDLLL